MTNDEIREAIAANGITTENVTQKQLMELHDRLSESLSGSDCFRGTFEMNALELDENIKYMTCRADYFEEREAISFNRDGFIGMAGWASSKNLKPIQEAVIAWAYDIGSEAA